MKNIGYFNPCIGVESGDDKILKKVHKGYDSKTAREQLEKLTSAGMPIIVNFLNGLGGKNFGLNHAKKNCRTLRKNKNFNDRSFIADFSTGNKFILSKITRKIF